MAVREMLLRGLMEEATKTVREALLSLGWFR